MSFDEATGTFYGKPTEYGVFPDIVIEATDTKNGLVDKTLSIDVQQDGSPITLKVTDIQTHVNTALKQNAPVAGNLVGDPVYSATGLGGSGFTIDENTGALTGSSTTVRVVSASVDVTDDTQRTATAAIKVTVLPAVTATAENAKLVYNHVPAAKAPVTTNVVGAMSWTLGSGTLPKGVSVDPATGALVGKPKELGDFGPITLAVKDSLDGTATTNAFTIHVDMNDDPIELTVAAYTAYKGSYIHTPAPPYDNNLGNVTFFSPEAVALGLSINPATGELTGRIDELMDVYINISVRDADTTRVTSKPLHLQVVPDFKLTYPAVMTSAQAASFNQTASIAYQVGSVTYSKDGGTWPEGFDVDPSTGAIVSANVIAATGTYTGLSVKADIVSNEGQTFQAVSNTLAIKVNPIDATPVITDITGNRMVYGTVGVAGTPFTPTVVDSKAKKPWIYSGTVYRLNYDLAADTGLTFDPTTGTISGTPTKAVIYRDLTITVVSSEGDSDTTAPFWFGVAPAGNITLSSSVDTTVKVRIAGTFTAPDLAWDNVIGNLTHTKTSGNAAFAVTSTNGKLTNASATSGWTAGSYPVVVKVTDEFGRTGSGTMTVVVRAAVKVTLTSSPAAVTPGFEYTASSPLLTASATGIYGTASWTVTGLPDGLSLDASGAVIGKVEKDAYANGTKFAPVFTVKDSDDRATGTATADLTVANGHLYWRIWDNKTTGNWWWNKSQTNLGTSYTGADTTTRFQGWGAIYSTFYEGSGYSDVSSLKVQNTSLANEGRNYTDVLWGISGNADPWQLKRDASGAWWKEWKFQRPVDIRKITWWWGTKNVANDNSLYSAILNPTVQWSDDGTTWTTLWSSTMTRSSNNAGGLNGQGTTCPATTCSN